RAGVDIDDARPVTQVVRRAHPPVRGGGLEIQELDPRRSCEILLHILRELLPLPDLRHVGPVTDIPARVEQADMPAVSDGGVTDDLDAGVRRGGPDTPDLRSHRSDETRAYLLAGQP